MYEKNYDILSTLIEESYIPLNNFFKKIRSNKYKFKTNFLTSVKWKVYVSHFVMTWVYVSRLYNGKGIYEPLS